MFIVIYIYIYPSSLVFNLPPSFILIQIIFFFLLHHRMIRFIFEISLQTVETLIPFAGSAVTVSYRGFDLGSVLGRRTKRSNGRWRNIPSSPASSLIAPVVFPSPIAVFDRPSSASPLDRPSLASMARVKSCPVRALPRSCMSIWSFNAGFYMARRNRGWSGVPFKKVRVSPSFFFDFFFPLIP